MTNYNIYRSSNAAKTPINLSTFPFFLVQGYSVKLCA